MVNTNMFEFKHPKYYKELRSIRNKLDQAISGASSTEQVERAPGPGLKLGEMDIASSKPQASSLRPEASSNKQQASSHKRNLE